MADDFDPLVPRPLDEARLVPLGPDADLRVLNGGKILAAPDDPALWGVWRDQLARWRTEARERLAVDDALYERPDLAWAARCYVVSQVWLWDELFFDLDAQRFTPDRFLADAQERFGGLDGVVLWHAYPVIGIDERNQWDFYDVPGLPRRAALHDAGVRVFVDYNPWDTGTRRGGDDAGELAEVIRRLGADGVFLDTLKNAGPRFRGRPGQGASRESASKASRSSRRERIGDHSLSWAQWFADTTPPGVLRAHLFERRHMQHHIRRWHRDHSGELISAWLNGVGVMVWEVVFGAWVGWNDRDAADPPPHAARAAAAAPLARRRRVDAAGVSRAVGARRIDVLARGHDPHALANTSATPISTYRPDGVGRWIPLHDDADAGARRSPRAASSIGGARPRCRRGVWMSRADADPSWLPDAIRRAEPRRRSCTAGPHARRMPVDGRRPASRPARLQEGAVRLAAGERVITVRYRQRETGMYEGAPYVDEWKPLPPRLHDQRTLERVVDAARRDPRRGPRGVGRRVRGVPRRDRRAGPDGCLARPARAPGVTFAACSRVRRVGGRAAADGGRVAARREEDGIPAPRDRSSGTGPSPSTATAALGSSCSRAARTMCRGVRLVLRRRGAASGILGEAAPAGTRGGCLVVHRIPGVLGGGRAMGALDGLTVIDVSTLFAGPMAAMHLGDMGAAVIKVEHPTRPDPARGHGPSKDGRICGGRPSDATSARSPSTCTPTAGARRCCGWPRPPTS